MSSAAHPDADPTVSDQRTTNTRQSAATTPRRLTPRHLFLSTSTRLMRHRPRSPSESRHTPGFPTPHIRSRQRRSHTIHVAAFPVGYTPNDLTGVVPSDHANPGLTCTRTDLWPVTDSDYVPRKPRMCKRINRETLGQLQRRAQQQKRRAQQQKKERRRQHETPPSRVCTCSRLPGEPRDSFDVCLTPLTPTRARVLDKLRSVLSFPPTSLPPSKAALSKAAVDPQAPLAADPNSPPRPRIIVTATPARPTSFLGFSRRHSTTPSEISVPQTVFIPVPAPAPVPDSPPSLPLPRAQSLPVPPSSSMTRHSQSLGDRALSATFPLSEPSRTLRRNSTMPKGQGQGPAKSMATPRLPTSIAKPIASAGGMSLDIVFAEPYVFLRGFEHNRLRDREQSSGYDVAPPILRGKMRLVVAKDVKIRGITIRLQNEARTYWPQQSVDGLKTDYEENDILRSQNQTVFNAIHGQWDSPYGSMCTYELKHANEDSFGAIISRLTQGPHAHSADSASIASGGMTSRGIKSLALDKVQARSFEKGDSPLVHPTQAKGYKTFHAGTYEYNFEFPIDHHQVETISVPHGSVKWHVEAIVERAGAFKPNLHGKKEVSIVRIPDLLSLETVDPIALARPWEDQMFYEIIISGKSFPIGGKIPIAFKITPLAKVQIHKLRVYITESIEYRASHKDLQRKETANRILLFEKAACLDINERFRTSDFRFVSGGENNGVTAQELANPSYPGNLLGNLESGNEAFWTSTEVEMNVSIPTCKQLREERRFLLHPDSSWRNAHVNHWIKVQMRVSRADPDDPEGKRRRHFEISIDSPLTILSCAANQGNMSLPRYTGRDTRGTIDEMRGFRCGCSDSGSDTSTVRPRVPCVPHGRPLSFFDSSSASTTPRAHTTPLASASSSDDSIVYTPSTSDEGEGSSSSSSAAAAAAAAAAASSAQPQRALTDRGGAHKPARPIHLMRVPSFAPPAFDDDNSPPPVLAAEVSSPPPQYDSIIGSPSVDGLADYFSRLADYDDTHAGSSAAGGLDESSDSDSENVPTRIASRTGRVNVSNPRTPGGARHGPSRSMDIQRPAATFSLNLPSAVRQTIRE